MKGFKNFKYKYEKQEDGVTATKYYGDTALFAYKDSDFNDIYTGITKIHRSILKLIPSKYIDLAGGYNNLDVIGIKCTVCTVNEKVILSISLKNCKTFKLTITKKYLQENDSLGLLNVNPITASIIYNNIKLFDFVLEDNHIDRNKTYNVYHNITYHSGLLKFLNKTRDKINNISIENEGNFIKSIIMFNGKEKIFAIKGKNIVSSTGEILETLDVTKDIIEKEKDNNNVLKHEWFTLNNGMFYNNNDIAIATYGKVRKITNTNSKLKYLLTDIQSLNTNLVLYLANLFLYDVNSKNRCEIIKEFTRKGFGIRMIRIYDDALDISAEYLKNTYLISFKVIDGKIFNKYGKEIDISESSLRDKENNKDDRIKIEDEEIDNTHDTKEETNDVKEDNRIYILNDKVVLGDKLICNFIDTNKKSDNIEILGITSISEDILKIAGVDTSCKILVPKIEFTDDKLMIVHFIYDGYKCNVSLTIDNGLYFGPTKLDISERYLSIPKEYYPELEKDKDVTKELEKDKDVTKELEKDKEMDYPDIDEDIDSMDGKEIIELIIKLKSLEVLKEHKELLSKLFTKEELKKKVDKLI